MSSDELNNPPIYNEEPKMVQNPKVLHEDSVAEEDDDNIVINEVEDLNPALPFTQEDVSDELDIIANDDSDLQETDPSESEDESIDSGETSDTEDEDGSDMVRYSDTQIDLRGESVEALEGLLEELDGSIGMDNVRARIRIVGSWENIIFRALDDISIEETRIQQALTEIDPEDRAAMSHVLKQDGKTVLKTAPIKFDASKSENRNLIGDKAVLAFECLENGGGYRVHLYNSGITVDVIVPTGNAIQTMLSNCIAIDKELGVVAGAHYFAYNDVMLKNQIVNFVFPLIINSSYDNWRKPGHLFSVIKLPDLSALIMTIAAICHKNGYEDFVTKCTRPKTEEYPEPCHHVETFNADLFSMIITRFSVLSKDSIDFMVNARTSASKSTLSKIAKYQEGLGFEGEVITFKNVSFTMKIPTVNEHISAGGNFLADIINEISGDNNTGKYDQIGFRYIRSFVPWIASVEKKDASGNSIQTSEPKVIIRELEKLDDKDKEGAFRELLIKYINKVQLTYVGYPVTECPKCKYIADTPSGMWTFDPFSAFFTLAFRYLRTSV